MARRDKGRDEEPAHPLRRKILKTIKRRLGINETGIQKATGLKRSTVRHHLRALLKAGLLTRQPIGRENHYFPAGTDEGDIERLSIATHGRAKNVLREILLDPGLSQAELAERVGMTRKTLRGYVDFLAEHGLLRERRDARNQRYWPGPSANPKVNDRVLRNPHPATPLPPNVDRDQESARRKPDQPSHPNVNGNE